MLCPSGRKRDAVGESWSVGEMETREVFISVTSQGIIVLQTSRGGCASQNMQCNIHTYLFAWLGNPAFLIMSITVFAV